MRANHPESPAFHAAPRDRLKIGPAAAEACEPACGSARRAAGAGCTMFVEQRLWRSLKYEEVHLKAYANGLEARIGIGQWVRFYNERRPHQALGYKTPAATWAAEVSPVDLPLRLDEAGASPTTLQGQQHQQNVVYL